MNGSKSHHWSALLLVFGISFGSAAPDTFPSGVVATVHPLATQAAVEAMDRGGNAIDAAVAAALTLGVVDGHNSGAGGGCFMLIRLAGGQVVALDGRETAPAAATRDMFVRDGRADPSLSQVGALAVGIPGSLKVYDEAARQYGKLTLKEHLLTAARLAEHGFPIDARYARRLAASTEELARFEASRRIFLDENRRPLRQGEILKQTDLAGSYRAMAEHGTGWFYEGPFAAATERWMKLHGGIVTREDFHGYKLKRREPVRSRYRGHEILGFAPPSSGGVHVAQILNILEHFDVKSLGAESPVFVHVVTEAMKLAFADRAHWLGDPDFVRVPRGLVSENYAKEFSERIDMSKATAVAGPGRPADAEQNSFGGHTTHFSTADREGNWVACTATVNLSFGSKVVVPGTGIVLNDQMDDFSIQPGIPNAFGLVGAEANAVQPGKRPLSSMSPTIVLKEGRPVLSLGAAGGPTIISQVVLAIVRAVDFEMPLDAAIRAPRFHHQWRPDRLLMESAWPQSVRDRLAAMGHEIETTTEMGAAQAVALDTDGSEFQGVADPRAEGKAGGR